MREKAPFVAKPFNKQVVHGHLREMLPDSKLPEPLKRRFSATIALNCNSDRDSEGRRSRLPWFGFKPLRQPWGHAASAQPWPRQRAFARSGQACDQGRWILPWSDAPPNKTALPSDNLI